MNIITISRGSLNAAKNLVKELSEKLKIPAFSREDVIKEAEDYGIKETGFQDISQIETRAPGIWEKHTFRRKQYILCFQTTLLDLIESNGSIIYEGHLGHMLLHEIPFVLRIRLLQTKEQRIKILMNENQVDYENAANYIRLIDERRQKWSNFLYSVDLENPVLYDLTINLETMSLKTAVEMIALALQEPEFQSKEEDLRRIKNLHLVTKAKLLLCTSPLTLAGDFNIEADSNTGSLIVRGDCFYNDFDKCEQNIKKVLSGLSEIKNIKVIKE